MPFIEVKTFREGQKLITIPSVQFDEGKYYVIVESHIVNDYLLILFEDEFFDEKVLNKISMDNTFVKSDKNHDLIDPKILNKIDDIGYYNLLGIYKGKDLIPVSKIVDKGVEFRYLKNIQKSNYTKTNCMKKINSCIFTPDFNDLYIPINIEILEGEVYLLNEYKSYLGISVECKVNIDGNIIEKGYYKLYYGKFTKTSEKTEIILSKGSVFKINDSTDELLSCFDNIMCD